MFLDHEPRRRPEVAFKVVDVGVMQSCCRTRAPKGAFVLWVVGSQIAGVWGGKLQRHVLPVQEIKDVRRENTGQTRIASRGMGMSSSEANLNASSAVHRATTPARRRVLQHPNGPP
eukprot:3123160-Amphidinium_carterae.1